MAQFDKELANLRRAQAERVMPKVGALLDAWDGTSNDEKATLRSDFPHLCELIESILDATESRRDA